MKTLFSALTILGLSGQVALAGVVTAKDGHDGFLITPECIEDIFNNEVSSPTDKFVANDLSDSEVKYSTINSPTTYIYIAAANNKTFSIGYVFQGAVEEDAAYVATTYTTQYGDSWGSVQLTLGKQATQETITAGKEGFKRVVQAAENCFQMG